MRKQRAAVIRLAVVTGVVAALAVLLLKVYPLYDYIHKGLDLKGGVQVMYQAKGTAQQPLTAVALQQTVQVIEYRINSLGVSQPVVQSEPKSGRIIVQLPGVKNVQQALQIIGQTATLQFKDSKGNVIVTGSDLQKAQVTTQCSSGYTDCILLYFNGAGMKKIADFTTANVGQTMPIYIGGTQIMSPTVQQAITTSPLQLTGVGDAQQAQAYAVELNSGALPLNLTVISETQVSPTLGSQSIQASKVAALLAIVLVTAFMFLVYRVPGFWADIALLVYALADMAVLIALHATLTLDGITGMILSIGMAVDSNVIIYERIKEELRGGRTLRTAVDEGFKHGLRAILDSNATTIIASIVLYELGSGLIRGFAVTVGIGVLISLLTAVVFTRYLLRWLVDSGIKPSIWVFAPRGELAVEGGVAAGGPVMVPAAPLAQRALGLQEMPARPQPQAEPEPEETVPEAGVRPDTPFERPPRQSRPKRTHAGGKKGKGKRSGRGGRAR